MSIIRFKSFMQERVDLSETGEETLLSVSEYYGVKPRKDAFSQEAFESRAASLEGYRRVFENDLVMNYMLAWKGAYGVSNFSGIVSPAYAVFKIDSQKAFPSYVHYCLRSERFKSYFRAHSKGIIESRLRLYPDTFLSLSIDLPDYETQKEIAAFLDRETARIDQLIEKKEKMISVLDERKNYLINRVIRNCLNPLSLFQDTTDPLIGSIPAHWTLKRLRHIAQMQNGISAGAEYFGSGFPFVGYGDVYKNPSLPKSVHGLANSSDTDRFRYSVQEGDIFFTRTSEVSEEIGISSVCLSSINAAVFSGFLIRVRPSNGVLHPNFSKYYFRSNIPRLFFTKEMNLVTRASLGQDLLKRLPVIIPPLEEQEQIATYLDEETGRTERLISQISKTIERLKNLKVSTITEAVTGQLDIRSWKKRGSTDHRLDQIEEAMAS